MRRNFLYKPNLKYLARAMRNEMTAAEKKLWYGYLRSHQCRFLRQKAIGEFILDFYCPSLKLVIEVDGETHLGKKDKIKDNKRTEILEKLGMKIMRFWNDEVLYGLDSVCEIIEEEIKRLNPPTPFVKGE